MLGTGFFVDVHESHVARARRKVRTLLRIMSVVFVDHKVDHR